VEGLEEGAGGWEPTPPWAESGGSDAEGPGGPAWAEPECRHLGRAGDLCSEVPAAAIERFHSIDTTGTTPSMRCAVERACAGTTPSMRCAAERASAGSAPSIQYAMEQVGRHLRSSKERHCWTLGSLGGAAGAAKVELEHSKVSGKRRVLMDGDLVFSTKERTFNWTWEHPALRSQITIQSDNGHHRLSVLDTADGAAACWSPGQGPAPEAARAPAELQEEQALAAPTAPRAARTPSRRRPARNSSGARGPGAGGRRRSSSRSGARLARRRGSSLPRQAPAGDEGPSPPEDLEEVEGRGSGTPDAEHAAESARLQALISARDAKIAMLEGQLRRCTAGAGDSPTGQLRRCAAGAEGSPAAPAAASTAAPRSRSPPRGGDRRCAAVQGAPALHQAPACASAPEARVDSQDQAILAKAAELDVIDLSVVQVHISSSSKGPIAFQERIDSNVNCLGTQFNAVNAKHEALLVATRVPPQCVIPPPQFLVPAQLLMAGTPGCAAGPERGLDSDRSSCVQCSELLGAIKGTHGCSLWLRKGAPLVPDLPGSIVKRHAVTLALAEPAILVVDDAVGVAATRGVDFASSPVETEAHLPSLEQRWE
ncbi:unnamed protein product, partial [Prorocentrum cordatum]